MSDVTHERAALQGGGAEDPDVRATLSITTALRELTDVFEVIAEQGDEIEEAGGRVQPVQLVGQPPRLIHLGVGWINPEHVVAVIPSANPDSPEAQHQILFASGSTLLITGDIADIVRTINTA